MAVSANRWHPLAFDARSYGLRRTVARSLFSHMSGALPPPRLLDAIDTRSPTTHSPTQRRSFMFHFYHAASIMVFCSPPTIAGVRTGRRHRRRRQTTRDRRRTHRAPSPAPSAVHQQSQVYAQGAVTGAVGSAPAIAGVRTGRRHRRRRQSTSNRRCTHRAPSPAPSAVHRQSQVYPYAQGAVTGAVGSAPEIAGVGRHRRRRESLPRHTVSESARSVADCRPTFDTCRSSEGWMWLP